MNILTSNTLMADNSALYRGGFSERPFCLWDALFLVLALLMAVAACEGAVLLSSHGAVLDDDLMCYAQSALAGMHRDLFAADPAMRVETVHNSFRTLERFLADLLVEGDDVASALLRAGGVALFLYYALWYLFGRYLFARPVFALLLALVQGITCWVGYGTFWGATYADPVPRVFYAALWPLFLWACLIALQKTRLKPLVMLAAGLSIWVHGISALTTGAMLFAAFVLIKKQKDSLGRHLLVNLAGLVCFLVPVFAFLGISLASKKPLSPDEAAVFTELLRIRYAKDYGTILPTLKTFFVTYSLKIPLLPLGLAGFMVLWKTGNTHLRRMGSLVVPFVLGMAFVFVFSVAEGLWAQSVGRMPLGHELVRGIRFLIPLAWLGIVAGCFCLLKRSVIVPRILVLILLAGLMVATPERQHLAALHTLHLDGLSLHGDLLNNYRREGQERAEVFAALKEVTKPGDMVFCNQDELGVRYLAQRGLVHSFKDGAYAFYDGNVERAKMWLHYNELLRQSPTGYIVAWVESGAPWLLSSRAEDRALLAAHGDIVREVNGWLIVQRR